MQASKQSNIHPNRPDNFALWTHAELDLYLSLLRANQNIASPSSLTGAITNCQYGFQTAAALDHISNFMKLLSNYRDERERVAFVGLEIRRVNEQIYENSFRNLDALLMQPLPAVGIAGPSRLPANWTPSARPDVRENIADQLARFNFQESASETAASSYSSSSSLQERSGSGESANSSVNSAAIGLPIPGSRPSAPQAAYTGIPFAGSPSLVNNHFPRYLTHSSPTRSVGAGSLTTSNSAGSSRSRSRNSNLSDQSEGLLFPFSEDELDENQVQEEQQTPVAEAPVERPYRARYQQ